MMPRFAATVTAWVRSATSSFKKMAFAAVQHGDVDGLKGLLASDVASTSACAAVA
jgi:hypothetical protein